MQDTKMADLTTPLITIILSKLPVKSLLRFRCVSKSWRSLIDEQYFINLHLKNSLQNPTHQTLIIKNCFLQFDTNYTNKDPYLYSIDYPTLNRATLINCPFDCDSVETEIVGSCNGLLCLADGIAAFIYNPATRKYRVLPVSPVEIPGYVAKELDRVIYGFGYNLVNDDYKLVRIIEMFAKNSDDHVSEMKVYSLKANTWKKVREFPNKYYIGIGFSWGAYVNGCLHWLLVRKPVSDGVNVLIAFDIGTEEYKVVPQPKYDRVSSNYSANVGVINGCLMVRVVYHRLRTDVWIMKENGVKESWTKLFTVPQWETVGFYQSLKPIVYLNKNGSEEVLFEKDFKNLVWLDVKRRRSKTVNTCGLPWSFDTVLMVESLVPLDCPKKKKKRKPKKKRNDSVIMQKEQPMKLNCLFATLSEKVLCHIFSQLPVKTLLQIQCVCKTWYSIINGPDFFKMHLEIPRKCNSGLSLVLKGDRFFSVNAHQLNKAVEINHPLLCDNGYTDIVGSCNGLVCLCKDQNIALWNPYTGKHEKIPCSDFHFEHAFNLFHYFIHGFGYDPTTDDYKIVSILQQHNRLKGGTVHTEVQVYSLKAKSWKLMYHFSYFICYPCYGVYASGALHWVARQSPDLYSNSNLLIAFDLGVEKCRVVTQPNYVDTDFHMIIGVLGGRLCFLCHYPKESFDLWVMDDYLSESWMKLVSISLRNVIGCFEYMKPLAYSEDGSEVLFVQDNEKLLWYSLTKKTIKYIQIHGLPKAFETVMCSSSIVPIGNAMRNFQVIHEQPVERTQKSRNKKERYTDEVKLGDSEVRTAPELFSKLFATHILLRGVMTA